MKRIILIYSVALFLISSCLSTDVVEVEMPYDKYIVVQGTLEKDSIFSGVRFTKTLSLNEPYQIKNSELTDVTAYLLIDETITIPLHYSHEGIYLPLYPHKIKVGSVYELFAEVLDTKIYSKTIVPDSIVVAKSELYFDEYIISEVKVNRNYVYGSVWEAYPSYNKVTAEDFHSIVPSIEENDKYTNVRTVNVPGEYLNGSLLYARVYAFDKFYREYFLSKGNNQSDSLFSNVTSPNWNINSSSSEVIGLFVGMAKSKPLIVSSN
ncbi:MAG: hypothetical protein PF445_03280 [Melioribacteraceae bacterium]|jgi:hypothetical protein|nr:hypothetical protein [Melioribacteraceae bacterium]